MPKKVSVIIATYNGLDYLKSCLPTVQKSEYSNFEIIVCDDASTDGTYKYLTEIQSKDDKLIIMQNHQNLGAAKSRNRAVSRATGEVLVFLDNDTQVDPHWIAQPLEILEKDLTVGGVQSLLIEYDQRDIIQLSGVHLIPHACWGAPIERHTHIHSRIKTPQNIIALSAALFVRKIIHDTIGGFDDKLAVYTEDLEYSLRIWISGSRIVGAPNSYVYHWTKKVADRKKMHSSKAQIYFHLTKNSFRSIIKNYQLTTLLQYMPFLILITIFRVTQCIINKDFSSAQSVLKGIFWTIRNLPDTLKVRSTVQSQRKFSDKIIFKEVFLRKSLFDIYYEYFAKK